MCFLKTQFHDFLGKFDQLQFDLVIPQNCNSPLVNPVINLKQKALSNAQYIRRDDGNKSCPSIKRQCSPCGKSLQSPVFEPYL